MEIFKMSSLVTLVVLFSLNVNVEADGLRFHQSRLKDLKPINCYGNTNTINTQVPAGDTTAATAANSWWFDSVVDVPCFMRLTYDGAAAYGEIGPIMVMASDAGGANIQVPIAVGGTAGFPGPIASLTNENAVANNKSDGIKVACLTHKGLMVAAKQTDPTNSETHLSGKETPADKPVKAHMTSTAHDFGRCMAITAVKPVNKYTYNCELSNAVGANTSIIDGAYLYFQYSMYPAVAADYIAAAGYSKFYIAMASHADGTGAKQDLTLFSTERGTSDTTADPTKIIWFWGKKMPVDADFVAADFTNLIEYVKTAPEASNCDAKTCPLNITQSADPAGAKQSWVAIKIPKGNLTGSFDGKFYIITADGSTAKATWNGMTEVPAGGCSQSKDCYLSIFIAEATVGDVDKMRICPWGSFKACTAEFAPWKAGESHGETDALKASNDANAKSLATVISNINYSPAKVANANGTTHTLAVENNGPAAKIFVEFHTAGGNTEKSYPLVIQGNDNVQFDYGALVEDVRGWKKEDGQNLADGGTYLVTNAGGTEYPTTCKAGLGSTCNDAFGCGAYGKGTISTAKIFHRHHWPHLWSNAGFKVLFPTYREKNINETSYAFATRTRTVALASITEAVTVGVHETADATSTKWTGINSLDLDLDKPYKWKVYALGSHANGTAMQSFTMQTNVLIKEYQKTSTPTGGKDMVLKAQLNKAGQVGNDLATEAHWEVGDGVRTIAANATDVKGTEETLEYVPKHTFSTTRWLALYLDAGIGEGEGGGAGGGGMVYLTNKSRVTSLVKGNCEKPAWHETAQKFFSYKFDYGDTIKAACGGLKLTSTAPVECVKLQLHAGGIASLQAGVYEIWHTNTTNSFPYYQSTADSSLTISPYVVDNAAFINPATVKVGTMGAATNPAVKIKYNQSGSLAITWDVSASATAPYDDMVGFILYFNESGHVAPTNIERAVIDHARLNTVDTQVNSTATGSKMRATQAEDYRWTRFCAGTGYQDLTKSQLAGGTNIRDCITHHGIGTYYIYVQIRGSTKYVKQTAYFTVIHDTTSTASGGGIVKSMKFKMSTEKTDKSKPGNFILDEMERFVCDEHASKGSKRKEIYKDDVTTNLAAMQLQLMAGSDRIEQTDECYLQIFDADCKTAKDPFITVGDRKIYKFPNGVAPTNRATVFDAYGNQLSGRCQTTSATTVSIGAETGANNYYNISPFVTKQFVAGTCIKMWARKNDAKWTLQTGSGAKITLAGYTDTTAGGSLISKFSIADVKNLHVVRGGGTNVTYKITTAVNAQNQSGDKVRICLKPADLATTTNDFFIRGEFDQYTAFCDANNLPQGVDLDWSADFPGIVPGKYDVYAKYRDVIASSETVDYCKKWLKQGTASVQLGWTKDPQVAASVSWGGDGYTDSTAISPTYVVTQDKKNVPQLSLTKWNGNKDKVYRLNIKYSKTAFVNADHQFYWSKSSSATEFCDCSVNRCTPLTDESYPPNSKAVKIVMAKPTWPSVGPPNCQHDTNMRTTDFPTEGKYYLCVNQGATYKGQTVQVNVDSVATNVSVNINPAPATAAPVTTVKPVPASSSAIAPLFAIVVAVLGAFLL